jgi:hypothetical protein
VNASAATVQRDDLTELDVAEILERDAEAEVRDARPRPDMKDVVSCFPVVVEVGAAASLCLLGHHEGQAGTVERDQSRSMMGCVAQIRDGRPVPHVDNEVRRVTVAVEVLVSVAVLGDEKRYPATPDRDRLKWSCQPGTPCVRGSAQAIAFTSAMCSGGKRRG